MSCYLSEFSITMTERYSIIYRESFLFCFFAILDVLLQIWSLSWLSRVRAGSLFHSLCLLNTPFPSFVCQPASLPALFSTLTPHFHSLCRNNSILNVYIILCNITETSASGTTVQSHSIFYLRITVVEQSEILVLFVYHEYSNVPMLCLAIGT